MSSCLVNGKVLATCRWGVVVAVFRIVAGLADQRGSGIGIGRFSWAFRRRVSEVWRLHNTYLGFWRTGINFTLYLVRAIFISPPPPLLLLWICCVCVWVFSIIHPHTNIHTHIHACINKVTTKSTGWNRAQKAKSEGSRQKDRMADKS